MNLSPRQIEVLDMLCEGKRQKEIAQHFGISESTVETHLLRARETAGVGTTNELIALWVRESLTRG